MSGAEPDEVGIAASPELIDWGESAWHSGLPSPLDCDLTLPADLWGGNDGEGTSQPGAAQVPGLHPPALRAVPPPVDDPIPVSSEAMTTSPEVWRPVLDSTPLVPLSGSSGRLDAAALDALLDLPPRPGPASRPGVRRQWWSRKSR